MFRVLFADDHPLFILRKLRAHRRMQAVIPRDAELAADCCQAGTDPRSSDLTVSKPASTAAMSAHTLQASGSMRV